MFICWIYRSVSSTIISVYLIIQTSQSCNKSCPCLILKGSSLHKERAWLQTAPDSYCAILRTQRTRPEGEEKQKRLSEHMKEKTRIHLCQSLMLANTVFVSLTCADLLLDRVAVWPDTRPYDRGTSVEHGLQSNNLLRKYTLKQRTTKSTKLLEILIVEILILMAWNQKCEWYFCWPSCIIHTVNAFTDML